MVKRGKLEIIKDILEVIRDNHNSIKFTPLLRKSNLSSKRFKEYYSEMNEKGFIKEITNKNNKFLSLTDKGFEYLEKFKVIIGFLDEFDL
jgi:predicted transcriptional regulator